MEAPRPAKETECNSPFSCLRLCYHQRTSVTGCRQIGPRVAGWVARLVSTSSDVVWHAKAIQYSCFKTGPNLFAVISSRKIPSFSMGLRVISHVLSILALKLWWKLYCLHCCFELVQFAAVRGEIARDGRCGTRVLTAVTRHVVTCNRKQASIYDSQFPIIRLMRPRSIWSVPYYDGHNHIFHIYLEHLEVLMRLTQGSATCGLV